MTDAPIEMALTCADCGASVYNDVADVKHPLEFCNACRMRGWQVPLNPPGPPVCPDCVAKRKVA